MKVELVPLDRQICDFKKVNRNLGPYHASKLVTSKGHALFHLVETRRQVGSLECFDVGVFECFA